MKSLFQMLFMLLASIIISIATIAAVIHFNLLDMMGIKTQQIQITNNNAGEAEKATQYIIATEASPVDEDIPAISSDTNPNEAREDSDEGSPTENILVQNIAAPIPPVFEEGESNYTGIIDTSKLSKITTKFGDVPFVLFCNSMAKDWGMMIMYLDQVTDNDIRYRRPSSNMSPTDNRFPAIVYSTDGKFIKTEGAFPPTDCENNNILTPSDIGQ